MGHYKYYGHSSQGQAVNGTLEAASTQTAASRLAGRGITPVKIEEVPIAEDYIKKINTFLGADRVSDVDLIMFCRQMHTITKAGIPLTRGIRGLSIGMRHDYFRETLNEIVDKLESGVVLSSAMRSFPKIFDGFFVNMINVGESTGRLDEVFRQIGFYIERDEETKKRIKSAMRYPTFVLFALAAAITTINILVVPEFASMFEKLNADLPLVTKILIGTSNIFVKHGHYLLLATVLVIAAFTYYIKTPVGSLKWAYIKLKLPVVGELIERASMSRYARSFSMMLKAGVPVTRSLKLCAASIDNPYLEEKIIEIKEGVERGESLVRSRRCLPLWFYKWLPSERRVVKSKSFFLKFRSSTSAKSIMI